MTPSEALNSNRTAIRHIVESHRARNPQVLDPRLLDSVLRAPGTGKSDLNILIDPTPEMTLIDVSAIKIELQDLLGVSVDVLTARALLDAFRNRVTSEAVPI